MPVTGRAAELLLLLWALHSGRDHGMDADALPPRPQQGLTSVETAAGVPEPYWHAAGFQIAGTRAVRIDMLERLSDLIRSRVTWRPVEGGAAAPSGATGDGGFRVTSELMSVVGCSGEDFASILRALGYRMDRRPPPPPKPVEAAETAVTETVATETPARCAVRGFLPSILRRKPHTDRLSSTANAIAARMDMG